MARRRLMEWAARPDHLHGLPRRLIISLVGAFSKTWVNFLNSTTVVHNADALLDLVRRRHKGLPLVTVSNHASTLDDPLLWGFKGFPICDPDLARWVLAADDICFTRSTFSYFFRLGKCIPITRGGGIYQEHMNEALERLSEGEWLHTFPEGKVCQEDGPIRRLKWGTASLIARAPVTPVVLPIVHSGFDKVMPDKSSRGKRPPFPLINKEIKIFIGEPMEFDIPKMRQAAITMSPKTSHPSLGWPKLYPGGLDEAAQRCLYSAISEKIQHALEKLRIFGASYIKDQHSC